MTTSVSSQIQQIAASLGVDPSLALAVAQQESGGNQSAVSSAGAIGVFQLMPTTAAGLGVDPNDLIGNITGGVTYLQQLLNQYNGNTSLALAAYNAGPGNVAKYEGIPPFTETQNYVTSIMNSLGVGSGSSSTDSTTTDNTDSSVTMGIDLTNPWMIGGVVLMASLVIWILKE